MAVIELPNIDDLSFKHLYYERDSLRSSLEVLSFNEDEKVSISQLVMFKAVTERLELVNRALQAFEKVTYRHLKQIGI